MSAEEEVYCVPVVGMDSAAVDKVQLRRQILMQYTLQKKFYLEKDERVAVEWNRVFVGSSTPHFPFFTKFVDDSGAFLVVNYRYFSYDGCVYDMLFFS